MLEYGIKHLMIWKYSFFSLILFPLIYYNITLNLNSFYYKHY